MSALIVYFLIQCMHWRYIWCVGTSNDGSTRITVKNNVYICKHYVHTDDQVIIFTPHDILKHDVCVHNRNYKSDVKLLPAISSKAKITSFTGQELVRLFHITCETIDFFHITSL